MTDDARGIDELASLARTALTDQWALPAGEWHAGYAVDRLDEIIDALNPAELTPAAAAGVATVLGRHLAALVDRLEAEGVIESGRSLIGDLLTSAGDDIDMAIDALNGAPEGGETDG